MRRITAIYFVLLLLSPSVVNAVNYYRYKDDNNVTVLGRTIPPQFVHKGYEILNQSGRVIEVIAPALTPEEIKERDERLAEQKRREEERQRQIEADKVLLRLFSHPNDAVRVLARKLNDIEAIKTVKNGKISTLEETVAQTQSKAANLERSGKTIPNNLIIQIDNAKEEIALLQGEIQTLETQAASEKIEMLKKIKRLELLTNKKADLSLLP